MRKISDKVMLGVQFRIMNDPQTQEYIKQLQTMGSLSKLFSDSDKPYLYYRIAENIFSNVFEAKNVGRSDIAIDAILNTKGVGLKTFTGHNGKASFQKVAEFNASKPLINEIRIQEGNQAYITAIAKLRNERILFAEQIFEIKNSYYHSVVRDAGKFSIYEEPMDKINIGRIKIKSIAGNSIHFYDQKNEYMFNDSKSTLYKKFHETKPILSFNVKILDDPIQVLKQLLSGKSDNSYISALTQSNQTTESIILPLYSTKSGSDYGQVPPKSGLNQWNAGGRKRSNFEAYIPIPSWIHRAFSGFLPNRDTKFPVILPSGEILTMKVCQENGKALMSDPNEKLGAWLLNTVLRLPEGELVTRKILDSIGIDSVELSKEHDKYYLNFKQSGSYEEFTEENNPK